MLYDRISVLYFLTGNPELPPSAKQHVWTSFWVIGFYQHINIVSYSQLEMFLGAKQQYQPSLLGQSHYVGK